VRRDIEVALLPTPGAPFEVRRATLDAPREDEILVRIRAAGICHTDLVMGGGRGGLSFPVVLGHEGAGVVEAVGARVTKVAPGDHVVMTINSCGECPSCRANLPPYCYRRGPLNGAGRRPDGSPTIFIDEAAVGGSFFGQSSFASFAISYERNTVKIPREFPFHLAAPLGCGVQTGAGAVLRSLDCRPGSSVIVAGGGAVGLSAVLAARARGCRQVLVVEPLEHRRGLAARLGATACFAPGPGLSDAVRTLCPDGVDYAIDTSGLPRVLEDLLGLLAPRGALGVIGLSPEDRDRIAVPITPIRGQGLTIRGIVEGDSDPDVFIPELIALHRQGELAFDAMVKTYAFKDINQAVSDHLQGGCVKPVLLFEEP
jgi:aryl-alcohol dehydrogenase